MPPSPRGLEKESSAILYFVSFRRSPVRPAARSAAVESGGTNALKNSRTKRDSLRIARTGILVAMDSTNSLIVSTELCERLRLKCWGTCFSSRVQPLRWLGCNPHAPCIVLVPLHGRIDRGKCVFNWLAGKRFVYLNRGKAALKVGTAQK